MRHAITDWNERGLVMGQTDVPLNNRGFKQIKDALELLEHFEIDALYSSSMRRCLQTAEILADALGLSVIAVDDFKERSWGAFEGRNRSERDPTEDPPGGETYKQFENRVVQAFRAIAGLTQKPLIVTHSGVIRIALQMEGGHARDARIPHVSPIKIRASTSKWVT